MEQGDPTCFGQKMPKTGQKIVSNWSKGNLKIVRKWTKTDQKWLKNSVKMPHK